jgi:hypothetical protein
MMAAHTMEQNYITLTGQFSVCPVNGAPSIFYQAIELARIKCSLA